MKYTLTEKLETSSFRQETSPYRQETSPQKQETCISSQTKDISSQTRNTWKTYLDGNGGRLWAADSVYTSLLGSGSPYHALSLVGYNTQEQQWPPTIPGLQWLWRRMRRKRYYCSLQNTKQNSTKISSETSSQQSVWPPPPRHHVIAIIVVIITFTIQSSSLPMCRYWLSSLQIFCIIIKYYEFASMYLFN